MSDLSNAWWEAFRTAEPSIKRKATFEVVVIGGLSIFPLLLGAYGAFKLQPISPDTVIKPFSNYIWAAIFSGQLYYYAMAFIASLVWYSAKDLEKPFPPRILFWCVAFILGMVCAFFFGLEPALPSAENSDLSYISIVVYLISAGMYYLILVFRKIPAPDLGKEKRAGEITFTQDLKNRRGVQQ